MKEILEGAEPLHMCYSAEYLELPWRQFWFRFRLRPGARERRHLCAILVSRKPATGPKPGKAVITCSMVYRDATFLIQMTSKRNIISIEVKQINITREYVLPRSKLTCCGSVPLPALPRKVLPEYSSGAQH